MPKSLSKTPAPKKDRIFGSDKNKKGSASSKASAKGIELNDSIVETLSNKAKEYNENHPKNKVSVTTLKAVMRRGMGAYSTSHRPTITGGAPNSRQAWGFARVNKFLKKKAGQQVKAAYVQDDDLMADGGILSDNGVPITFYHGTTDKGYSSYKYLYFTADKEYASLYAEETGRIIEVYLKINNPFVIQAKYMGQGEIILDDEIIGYYRSLQSDAVEKLKNAGYDGIVVHYPFKNKKYFEVIPFDKSQIIGETFADGGLIAPNGNPSNLTPEQYKLVRTPEFKAWFGDWENDPINSSKIVDSNGEPFVVYHGTESKFNIFDKNLSGKLETIEGVDRKIGIYFSNKKSTSRFYTKGKGVILECFLNVRKPSRMKGGEISTYEIKIAKEEYGKDGIIWNRGSGIWINGKQMPLQEGEIAQIEYIVFESNQIKLADGTNKTFDMNNPDIRYADGGETKKSKDAYTIVGVYKSTNELGREESEDLTKEGLLGYRLRDNKMPMYYYGYVVYDDSESGLERAKEDYEKYNRGAAAEKERKRLKDIENKIKREKQKIIDAQKLEAAKTDDSAKPAYLMTNSEYQDRVVPLLKEYEKFARKNSEYLSDTAYSGFYKVTFEQVLSRGLEGKKTGYYFRNNDEKELIENWNERKFRKYDDQTIPKPTPKDILEKNVSFLKDLNKFFDENVIFDGLNSDYKKSNKAEIRRAIEDDTYKKMIENGEITEDEVIKIAEEQGVKVPKKVFSQESLLKKEAKKQMDEILSKIPKMNQDIFDSLYKQLYEDFKDVEKIVFERETERYEGLIKEYIELSKKEGGVNVERLEYDILFFRKIFKSSEPIVIRGKDSRGYPTSQYFQKDLELKSDYKPIMDKINLDYAESLKYRFLNAVLDNFPMVTKPISDVTRESLKVGKKGFEGRYRFNFADGSYFDFVTEAIPAAGYNIVAFHYRYITHLENATLADGTKVKGYYEIMDKFSSESMADGGQTGQAITCVNCGWHWNTSDSDEFDKYICHKCGFDNRTFYDPEPIGKMADGGVLGVPSTENLIELVRKERENKIREWNRLGFRVVVARNDGYSYEKESERDTQFIDSKNPSERKVADIIKNNPDVLEIGFNGTIKVGKRVGEELEIADDFSVVLWKKDDSFFKEGLKFEFVQDSGKYINTIVNKKDTITYKDRQDDGKYVYFKQLDVKYNTESESRSKKDILKEEFDNKEAIFIKDKYADGGLIAPNGKKSNLTSEQYKLVRTPEFKAWFGDWENDPENASKVVDENGEPKVVYHATNNKYNEFSYEKASKGGGAYGNIGFYFTSYKQYKSSSPYGKIIKQVFLNLRNPFVTANGFYKEEASKSLSKNQILKIIGDRKSLDYDKEKLIQRITEKTKISRDNEIFYQVYPIEVQLHWIWEAFFLRSSIEDFQKEVIKATKYDGSYIFNADYYVAFLNTQIKLADGTNTTFDNSNPDIRYADGGALGKSKVYYHGSNLLFKDIKFIPKESGESLRLGEGVYVTNDKEVAKKYGKYVYELISEEPLISLNYTSDIPEDELVEIIRHFENSDDSDFNSLAIDYQYKLDDGELMWGNSLISDLERYDIDVNKTLIELGYNSISQPINKLNSFLDWDENSLNINVIKPNILHIVSVKTENDKEVNYAQGGVMGQELFKPSKTIEQIAKEKDVPLDYAEEQLRKGMKTESEHSDNTMVQETIALQHLDEMIDYYDKLEYIESQNKMAQGDLQDNSMFNKYLIYKSIKPIREANEMMERLDYMESQNKMANGGVTKFYKEYLDWYIDGVYDKMTIMVSVPNALSKMSGGDNDVILDVFEKKDENVDAKKKLTELLEIVDRNGLDVYLEPIPRLYNIKDEAKRDKITREYLIKYYENFGFELLSNGFMVRKYNKMEKGGYYKAGGEINPDNKSVKDYFSHGSGDVGGVLVGKRHSEGGIKAVNKSTNQPLEMEGGEVVITRNAVSDNTKREFNGEMLTNREILSKINESGGGVSFADGGDIPETISTSGKEYKYGGKMMKDYEIVSSCGCNHSMAEGGKLNIGTIKKTDSDVIFDKQSGTFYLNVIDGASNRINKLNVNTIDDIFEKYPSFKLNKLGEKEFEDSMSKGGITGDLHSLTNQLLAQKIEIFIKKVMPIKFYYIDESSNSLIIGLDENYTTGMAEKLYKEATSSAEFFDADSINMEYNQNTGHAQYSIKLKKVAKFGKGGSMADVGETEKFKVERTKSYDGRDLISVFEYIPNEKVFINVFSLNDKYKQKAVKNNYDLSKDEDVIKFYEKVEKGYLAEGGETDYHTEIKNNLFPKIEVEVDIDVEPEMDLMPIHEHYITADDLGLSEGMPMLAVGTIVYSSGGNDQWEVVSFSDDGLNLVNKPKSPLQSKMEDKHLTFEELIKYFKDKAISIKNISTERELEPAIALVKNKLPQKSFAVGGFIDGDEDEDAKIMQSQFGKSNFK